MKVVLFSIIAIFLCGCSSLPFDVEFNRLKIQHKEEKLVLGKPVQPLGSPSTDKTKLNISRNPKMSWERKF